MNRTANLILSGTLVVLLVIWGWSCLPLAGLLFGVSGAVLPCYAVLLGCGFLTFAPLWNWLEERR